MPLVTNLLENARDSKGISSFLNGNKVKSVDEITTNAPKISFSLKQKQFLNDDDENEGKADVLENVATSNRVKKTDQMYQVIELVKANGFLPTELVTNEVAWFYENLGIDDVYFAKESDSVIAGHIIALYAAKLNAFVNNKEELEINLVRETENGAVYIHTSKPGISVGDGRNYERKIDLKYLDRSNKTCSYRLETYRSQGTVSSKHSTQLRCYFISECQFLQSQQKSTNDGGPAGGEMGNLEVDIMKVGDRSFLEKASFRMLEIYQKMIINVLQREGPVIEVYDTAVGREKRLVVGYKQETTKGFFSSLSDLYHFYGLYSTKKYVEQFSNGVTIMSIYLNPLQPTLNGFDSQGNQFPPIENSVIQIMKESSLIYCIPFNPLLTFFQEQRLSVQEMVYGYCALVFTQHFLNRLGNEYAALQSVLNPNNPSHFEVLTKLKKRLRQDTFTRQYVLDIVKLHPDLIKILYQHFGLVHYITTKDNARLKPTLSFVRLHSEKVWNETEILDKIKRTVSNNHEQMVFEAFLTFNMNVLKTNFYQPTKVALSFRLNPSFLPLTEYPQIPFGMFLVIGNEFRGFHVRFQDIARGGIRIIRSRNREAYSINFRGLFDENYSLAATQQRKNKDIPEGGSKGTILLDNECQDKARIAFEKYIDSMIDLLVEGESPGIKEKLVDLYGKPEIIFFGPDEGSADYMDWASQHAKARGIKYWKAFTTGKSSSLGGIPHDKFGMTTHSIHQYVLGIYRKLGLKEESITKIQTGGPDGDLGSNEIKISKDKTIGVVDGTGVLYDPLGIDRGSLRLLADQRKPINYFPKSKLSKEGFMILIDDKDVTLPDGNVVEDGLLFRNEFHLSDYAVADLFVPCGGRPEAVDVNNWHRMLNGDGTPKFKYIVEGANLFFTQEARLRLEGAGCVIFKDASANKGGVTSSSLEVLASLALSDDEFERLFVVKDEQSPPKFYSSYIKAVQQVIEKNTELEFEAIWRENRKTCVEKSRLSDELSLSIVKLDQELQVNSLYENSEFKKMVLTEAIPSQLIHTLSLQMVLERVPDPYIRALFGSYLASRFVYQYGTNPNQFAFFEFMSKYYERIGK